MEQAASVSSIPDTAAYLGMTIAELTTIIGSGDLAVVTPHEEPMIHEFDLEDYITRSLRRPPRRGQRLRTVAKRRAPLAVGVLTLTITALQLG